MMQRYGNLSGNSGVAAYEIGDDFVAVRFDSGTVYWYTDASVGRRHVAAMARLARAGRGLGTYISRHGDVKDNYARKEPPR